jgi:tripartite-type tricarboxylate transporter receptor subunit TctC
MRLTAVWGLAAALAACLALSDARAQSYPQKPVHLIVPFAPGGVTDVGARIVGQKLGARWGQQVVVENRPGAGAIIGVEAAARSAPDGYTFLMVSGDFATIYPSVYPKLPYDPEKDFIPVAMVINAPMIIVASSESGIKSVADLVAAARKRPGEITYSTPGNGTVNQLAAERLASETGIKLLHVPYRGGAPAATATASGEVALGVTAIPSGLPYIKSGKLVVLGVTTAQRASFVPDWPTIAESGLSGFEAALWVGLFAPSGVPQPIIDQVRADIGEVIKDPDFRERLVALGAEPLAMTPDAFAARIRNEAAGFARIVKQAGIHID